MGGKGRKRREKNYKAAHGGHSRLPPPPSSSSLHSLPSKLKLLISFVNSQHPGLGETSMSSEHKNVNADGVIAEKKLPLKHKPQTKSAEIEEVGQDEYSIAEPFEEDDFTNNINSEEKKKKMKKRKRGTDLRFETLEGAGVGSGRRERKKKRLKDRKEKKIMARSEDKGDFLGHEEIKFGDIVKAPPKLLAVPKGSKVKTFPDASNERLRLRAIEAYRNKKGTKSKIDLALPVMS